MEILVYHLVQAGAHRDAAIHLLTAGLEAEKRGVLERAQSQYARALECAHTCEASSEVSELRGDAALLMGDLASAEAAYRTAQAGCAKGAAHLFVKRALVYYRRAEIHYRDGEQGTARDLLRQAHAWLEASGSAPDMTSYVRQAIAMVTHTRVDRWPTSGLQRQGDRFEVILHAPEV
jgi:tetratricopeptide (TPR) repeat protein